MLKPPSLGGFNYYRTYQQLSIRWYTGYSEKNKLIYYKNMCENKCYTSKNTPRIFLSALFVIGGFGFLMNFSGTTQYVAVGLTPFGLAGVATIATIIAIILKLGGGLMLLFNYRSSSAAWMLIIFTVLATIMYHLNWNGDAGQMQMVQFFKNLAIVGGLMMFAKCPCPTCRNESSCCTASKSADVNQIQK